MWARSDSEFIKFASVLRNNVRFCDIVFQAKEELTTVKAHRLILAYFCHCYGCIFEEWLHTLKSSSIPLSGIDKLVKFIYQEITLPELLQCAEGQAAAKTIKTHLFQNSMGNKTAQIDLRLSSDSYTSERNTTSTCIKDSSDLQISSKFSLDDLSQVEPSEEVPEVMKNVSSSLIPQEVTNEVSTQVAAHLQVTSSDGSQHENLPRKKSIAPSCLLIPPNDFSSSKNSQNSGNEILPAACIHDEHIQCLENKDGRQAGIVADTSDINASLLCHEQLPEVSSCSIQKLQQKFSKKKYICEHCGKLFPSQAALQRHTLTHTGEKPFSCDQCKKSFSLKANLVAHQQIHDNNRVKNYTCEQCQHKAFSKSQLLQHIRNKHAVKDENRFECERCGKNLNSKAALQKHMIVMHEKEEHTCQTCEKTFSWRHYLRQHEKLHQVSSAFVCTHCTSRFWTKETLENHIRKLHLNI